MDKICAIFPYPEDLPNEIMSHKKFVELCFASYEEVQYRKDYGGFVSWASGSPSPIAGLPVGWGITEITIQMPGGRFQMNNFEFAEFVGPQAKIDELAAAQTALLNAEERLEALIAKAGEYESRQCPRNLRNIRVGGLAAII